MIYMYITLLSLYRSLSLSLSSLSFIPSHLLSHFRLSFCSFCKADTVRKLKKSLFILDVIDSKHFSTYSSQFIFTRFTYISSLIKYRIIFSNNLNPLRLFCPLIYKVVYCTVIVIRDYSETNMYTVQEKNAELNYFKYSKFCYFLLKNHLHLTQLKAKILKGFFFVYAQRRQLLSNPINRRTGFHVTTLVVRLSQFFFLKNISFSLVVSYFLIFSFQMNCSFIIVFIVFVPLLFSL